MPTKDELDRVATMDHSAPGVAAIGQGGDGGSGDEGDPFTDRAEEGDPTGPSEGGEEAEEAIQLKYLQDAPEWAVLPPRGSDFANATWLEGGREVLALVHEVLGYEEFADFGQIDIAVRWRRKSKPFSTSRDKQPRLATAEVVEPRMIWEAERAGAEGMPRLLIDLHWQHFADRRAVAPFYVNGAEVQRDVHRALSGLYVHNEGLRTVAPDVIAYAETVRRFGKTDAGIRRLARAASLWPDDPAEAEADGAPVQE